MPLYTVDIEKRVGSEFWSNRYIVQATTLAAAQVVADDITGIERSFHINNVLFTRYRVSTLASNDDSYVIVPVGLLGQRVVGSSGLPLFNTLRMDFPAPSGRPSRKFYRGVLSEGDINGDAITESFVDAASDISGLLGNEGIDGIVDPQNQYLGSAVVHPFVQMRQLRRSRRRRTNGGGIFQ